MLRYSIYLFHYPIYGVFGTYVPKIPDQPSWHHTLAAAALSLGLGIVTWRLIERPFLRLRRHFEVGVVVPKTKKETGRID